MSKQAWLTVVGSISAVLLCALAVHFLVHPSARERRRQGQVQPAGDEQTPKDGGSAVDGNGTQDGDAELVQVVSVDVLSPAVENGEEGKGHEAGEPVTDSTANLGFHQRVER